MGDKDWDTGAGGGFLCSACDIHIQLLVGYSSFLLPPQQSHTHISSCTLTEIGAQRTQQLVSTTTKHLILNYLLYITHPLYKNSGVKYLTTKCCSTKTNKYNSTSQTDCYHLPVPVLGDSNWLLHFSAGRSAACASKLLKMGCLRKKSLTVQQNCCCRMEM